MHRRCFKSFGSLSIPAYPIHGKFHPNNTGQYNMKKSSHTCLSLQTSHTLWLANKSMWTTWEENSRTLWLTWAEQIRMICNKITSNDSRYILARVMVVPKTRNSQKVPFPGWVGIYGPPVNIPQLNPTVDWKVPCTIKMNVYSWWTGELESGWRRDGRCAQGEGFSVRQGWDL